MRWSAESSSDIGSHRKIRTGQEWIVFFNPFTNYFHSFLDDVDPSLNFPLRHVVMKTNNSQAGLHRGVTLLLVDRLGGELQSLWYLGRFCNEVLVILQALLGVDEI